MDNRLNYFLGKPVQINGVNIYSPTINSIVEIGEIQYSIYLAIATFNKETVFKYLFNLDDDRFKEIENDNAFDLFILIPVIREELIQALKFFIHEDDVEFIYSTSSFFVKGKEFLNRNNYEAVAKIIKESNGVIDDNKPLKFKNNKAKEMYEKLQKLRSQYKKNEDDSLGLKDMLSVLCNADGNGINIFNVGNLTIYQVYEHFERLNIKEKHTRLLRVWANGYLGKDEKLPEWITKGKF